MYPRYGRTGASSRYRTFAHLEGLEAVLDEVSVHPLFTARYTAMRYRSNLLAKLAAPWMYLRRLGSMLLLPRDAFVVVEKELFPYVPYPLERWLLDRQRGYSLDYDDAVYEYYRMPSTPRAIRRLLGRKHERLMAGARLITVGNAAIGEVAAALNANVHFLPTCVDVEKYSRPYRLERRTHGLADDAWVLGWIGTPNSDKNLAGAMPGIRRFLDDEPATALLLVGGGRRFADAHPRIVFAEWAEDTEAGLLQLIDLGIMPLDDSPVERGKSGLKLVQYLACGKPVLASAVGENRRIVANAPGELVPVGADWGEALHGMHRRRAELAARHDEAAAFARREYSLRRRSAEYAQLLRDALRASRPSDR